MLQVFRKNRVIDGLKMNKRKKLTKHQIISLVIAYVILILLALSVLYPLAMMINVSFKSYGEFLLAPMKLAKKITFINYKTVFEKMFFLRMAINSIFYCAVSAAISCIIALLAAFPLSRKHFRGAGFVYGFILASMFMPGSLIANIVLVKDILHIYGTKLNIIFLWSLSSLQMNIFMTLGFVKQLPRDLDDAAWVDGCSYLRYIFVVSLPLLMPIVATIFTFRFVGMWNDFLTPFIYLSNPLDRPLATGLFFLKSQYGDMWNEICAAIALVAAPMVVLYCFMQRFIIEGMTAGALKG